MVKFGDGVGIAGYATYAPRWRLERSARPAQFRGRARESRAVAGPDEDTTTLGAEAARRALRTSAEPLSYLYFATTRPTYVEKSNATAVAAAAGCDSTVGAFDAGCGLRSGFGALVAAAGTAPAMAVAADLRFGLPGSDDDELGGDAAAAFVFGADPLAEIVATTSLSEEFVERWRRPGDTSGSTWEDRFGLHLYAPLLDRVIADVLDAAGMTADQIDHVALTSPNLRSAAVARGKFPAAALVPDPADAIGHAGAAQLGLVLAAALDRAGPDQTILLVSAADGVDAMVLRTTARHRARPQPTSSERTLAVDHTSFLIWRGLLNRELPRRPDPISAAAPPSARSAQWKFTFTASRCDECGQRHLPPETVCLRCHAVDRMKPEPIADVHGTVNNLTVDHLAFSLSPPVVIAVVDFDGGGRYECEMTDVDPAEIEIGDRVQMTFRLLGTSANGIANYGWKARPVDESEAIT